VGRESQEAFDEREVSAADHVDDFFEIPSVNIDSEMRHAEVSY